MASHLVGQNQIATFITPVNGTSPIDANQVRGNDNSIKTAYNFHDLDPTLHIQDSTLAARPPAGVEGRKWMTVDEPPVPPAVRLWYDTGTAWVELSYLSASAGGTFTAPVSFIHTSPPQITIGWDLATTVALGVGVDGWLSFVPSVVGAGVEFLCPVDIDGTLAVISPSALQFVDIAVADTGHVIFAADGAVTPTYVFQFGAGVPATAILNILLNSGAGVAARPTLIFQRGGVSSAFVAIGGQANDLIVTSAVGDFMVRAQTQNIIFSADGGTSPHLKIAPTGLITVFAANGALAMTSPVPRLRWFDTDGTANNRDIDAVLSGAQLDFEARDDALGFIRNVMSLAHTGTVTIGQTLGVGTVNVTGRLTAQQLHTTNDNLAQVLVRNTATQNIAYLTNQVQFLGSGTASASIFAFHTTLGFYPNNDTVAVLTISSGGVNVAPSGLSFPILIQKNTSSPTFGTVSFNANTDLTNGCGMTGSGNSLFIMVPLSGTIDLRSNGINIATVNTGQGIRATRFSVDAGTYIAANGAEAMGLYANGGVLHLNLAVGVITANGSFQCGGAALAGVAASATNNSISSAFTIQAWNQAASGDNRWVSFYSEGGGGTLRGGIDFNRAGGLVRYGTTSDYRVKEIRGAFDGAGEIIDRVPVYFAKMKDAEMWRAMFSAHEVQPYCPWAVSGEKDKVVDGKPEFQMLDHSSLVPVLWAEVQSLRARVAALEN